MASRKTNRGHQGKQTSPTKKDEHRPPSIEVQQKILDVFVRAFGNGDQNRNRTAVIQEVKAHLFNRDFPAAFGKPEYLEAYAVRWSAARALAYTDILMHEDRYAWLTTLPACPKEHCSVSSAVSTDTPASEPLTIDQTASKCVQVEAIKVVCIGGGAGAEIIALAGVTARKFPCHSVNVLAIDIADWTRPVQQLLHALTTPPTLSLHASKAIRDSNKPLVDPAKFHVTFLQKDILDLGTHVPTPTVTEESQSSDHDGEERVPTQGDSQLTSQSKPVDFIAADMVTLMFTLNELFATSLAKTTALLLRMSDTMKQGSHLVVVDSPGSYSEIKLGKDGKTKKYPMRWLVDHTLLEAAGEGVWLKVEDNDSMWFRLDNRGKDLRYPVELENCRYQIHVYRKQ